MKFFSFVSCFNVELKKQNFKNSGMYSMCGLLSVIKRLIFWKIVMCYKMWLIGLVGRVFANGPGDLGSILGWVIPKTKNSSWYLLA